MFANAHSGRTFRRNLLASLTLLAVAVAPLTPSGKLSGQEKLGAGKAAEYARGLSEAFRLAAEHATPTVVTVETKVEYRPVAGLGGGPNQENPFEGTPLEKFFDEGVDPAPGQRELPKREGIGSGVIVDVKGIILTNHHVVADARPDEVTIKLHDGQTLNAVDIKSDPATDLAVIRVEPSSDLHAAMLGDSDKLSIGDWVIAVGNPFGLESTVSAGIISAKGREIRAEQRGSYLQTDAAINPGNSGGPLLDLDGEVVGINTAIATNNGAYQGVGFAIPSNLAKWVMQQLIENGTVQRAYMGVRMGPVDGPTARKFKVRAGRGLFVGSVAPGGPAYKAGLRADDIITHIDGQAVDRPHDLQERVERAPIGSVQTLTVLRNGESRDIEVRVESLPADFAQGFAPFAPGTGETDSDLGIEVAEMTAADAARLNLDGKKGVVVRSVTPEGMAASVGIKPGDAVTKIGKHATSSVEEFKQAMQGQSLAKGIHLLVQTEEGQRYIVVQRQ